MCEKSIKYVCTSAVPAFCVKKQIEEKKKCGRRKFGESNNCWRENVRITSFLSKMDREKMQWPATGGNLVDKYAAGGGKT